MAKEWEKLKDIVVLQPDEKPAYVWWNIAYFELQMQSKTDFQLVTLGGHRGRTSREKEGSVVRTGDLVLTNKRLIWFEKKGAIKKDFHMEFDIPLETVTGVSSQGVVPKLVVSDGRRGHEFRLKDVAEAVKMINEKVGQLGKVTSFQTANVPQSQVVLAICPKCKNRIPSESKFCPECGENLQP
jgi:hypothetical protein